MARMNKIKTLCVYCGSGPGTNPRFIEAAIALGRALAENGIRLVYGGGSIGLMGAVATSVLDHGGGATGRTRPDARSGNDRHARHARTQAADVRAFRRVRCAARRNRHAGGTGGAANVAETRPPLKADPDREHRRLLGTAAGIAHPHARDAIHSTHSADRYSESRTGRGYPAAAARRRGPRDGR